MRLVLLGPPGAGKGTQAVHLAALFEVPHIATGDIFRDNATAQTALGLEAKTYMDRGELVPDELVIRMVGERLERSDANAGFVLDGFPRTVPQARALSAYLDDQQRPLDAVIRLGVPESEIVERIVNRRTCPADGRVYHLTFAPPRHDLLCDDCSTPLVHREDDTEAVVHRRLEEYRAKTEPLEHYYEERGLLRDVESVGPVEEVTRRAMAVVGEQRGGDAA